MAAKNPARTSESIVDVEQSMAVIEKGQHLAGHYPSTEDLGRSRRVLTGELTPEAARAEMHVALSEIAAEERGLRRSTPGAAKPGQLRD